MFSFSITKYLLQCHYTTAINGHNRLAPGPNSDDFVPFILSAQTIVQYFKLMSTELH